jgi:hypothetical protein
LQLNCLGGEVGEGLLIDGEGCEEGAKSRIIVCKFNTNICGEGRVVYII